MANLHASFVLGCEFREKIKRTKEDFGVPGNFISVETLRGIFDFPIKDSNFFESFSPNAYDLVLVRGRAVMRLDRLTLEPTEFIVCDSAELAKQAERFAEFGQVDADVRVSRAPYPDKINDSLVPRVECKAFGFCDRFVDDELFRALPAEKGSAVDMIYRANVTLDVLYNRSSIGVNRRYSWILSGQHVRSAKREQRDSKADKQA